MNAAFLVDADWLDEYLPIYRHLVIGLIDESVPVVQVVPDILPPRDTVSLGQVLYWQPSRFNWLTHRRLMNLADPLQAIGVDVIHLATLKHWKSGLALAQAIGASIAFDVFNQGTLDVVEDVHKAAGDMGLSFITATETMQQQTTEALGETQPVILARPGLHARELHRSSTADRATCLTITIPRSLQPQQEGWLVALGRLVREYPDLMVFADVPTGSPSQDFWRRSQKLDLFSHLTLATRPLGRFDMLTHADALVMPVAAGQIRGIALQAMASGLPILAMEDPLTDYLQEGETCKLVSSDTTEAWYEAIKWLLDHPAEATQLGERARQWASQHCRVSNYVHAVIDAYRQASGESIPFNADIPEQN